MLLAAAASSLGLATSGPLPPRFTINNAQGQSSLVELIGPSRVRHESHMPSFDNLERMLTVSMSSPKAVSRRSVISIGLSR